MKTQNLDCIIELWMQGLDGIRGMETQWVEGKHRYGDIRGGGQTEV